MFPPTTHLLYILTYNDMSSPTATAVTIPSTTASSPVPALTGSIATISAFIMHAVSSNVPKRYREVVLLNFNSGLVPGPLLTAMKTVRTTLLHSKNHRRVHRSPSEPLRLKAILLYNGKVTTKSKGKDRDIVNEGADQQHATTTAVTLTERSLGTPAATKTTRVPLLAGVSPVQYGTHGGPIGGINCVVM